MNEQRSPGGIERTLYHRDDVLDDDACPYCARPGNGEPCAPYCGASDEAMVACIDRAVLAMGED